MRRHHQAFAAAEEPLLTKATPKRSVLFWRVGRYGLINCWAALLLSAAIALASNTPTSAYVKVSPRDPRYFELSDGEPYVPIGFNLVRAPKEDEFERVLDAMAGNKINYCRIWLNDLPWQLEHQSSGVYDAARGKLLRRFLDLANQRGVRVKLCLEEFREIKPRKQADKDNTLHHRANGGPFQSMQDFLYTEQGQALFLRKVAC